MDMIKNLKNKFGMIVYGETLASSLGITINEKVKKLPSTLINYITSPPIRNDPDTPRQLMIHLAL